MLNTSFLEWRCKCQAHYHEAHHEHVFILRWLEIYIGGKELGLHQFGSRPTSYLPQWTAHPCILYLEKLLLFWGWRPSLKALSAHFINCKTLFYNCIQWLYIITWIQQWNYEQTLIPWLYWHKLWLFWHIIKTIKLYGHSIPGSASWTWSSPPVQKSFYRILDWWFFHLICQGDDTFSG